jgi:hypothetical protein
MSDYRSPYLEPHQTRTQAPSDWEMELSSAIENAFSKGAHELDELVAALNASRVRPRTGGGWTAENFTALMRELGA